MINDTFEALSDSKALIPRFNELTEEFVQKEAQIRVVSDKLREKRHEKIRTKGLQDYQNEIERCVAER